MSLVSIRIRNYKSIQDFSVELREMNLFLGENGSGKTNVLSALGYFYENMISQKPSYQVFDTNNPLNDQMEITLTYDMHKLLVRSRRNRQMQRDRYLPYYKMMETVAEDEAVSLTMRQVKGGRITWSHDIQTRKLLYHLYPLYHVDAREINLVDWEDLWTDIGDLIKPDSETGEELQQRIADQIRATEGDLGRRLAHVDEMLERLSVDLNKYSVREWAAHVAKAYYGGADFACQGHELDSLSNGTNSYNYIALLVSLLGAMGQFKMKEPVLLMDEPEISLHFHMIDELSDVLLEGAKELTILAATHSPRLVRNIFVKEQSNCLIYQVYKRGEYSNLCRLRLFSEQERREKYFLTEHHANAFFAKILILVEGETELELLQNPYLRLLFPVLKQAEIIKGMSDKVIYRIVDTNTRHYQVPMLALLDMDKILQWNFEKSRMDWRREYRFVEEQERYTYGRKHSEAIRYRRRIHAMCEKCYFDKRLPFYATTDRNYWEMIGAIREYYALYHIFPVETTIEGVLINGGSQKIILGYLDETGKWKQLEEAYQTLYNRKDQVNFLRLLFHGKSDLLLKGTTIMKKNPRMYPQLKKALREQTVGKTAWVSGFLQFYFSHAADVPKEKLTLRRFAQLCEEEEVRRLLRERVMRDFPELYQFQRAVQQAYQDTIR